MVLKLTKWNTGIPTEDHPGSSFFSSFLVFGSQDQGQEITSIFCVAISSNYSLYFTSSSLLSSYMSVSRSIWKEYLAMSYFSPLLAEKLCKFLDQWQISKASYTLFPELLRIDKHYLIDLRMEICIFLSSHYVKLI